MTKNVCDLFNAENGTHFAISNDETVTVVPEWHCYDFSTIRLLQLSHSDTVMIASQWHFLSSKIVSLNDGKKQDKRWK